jgi:hypothetical protein
MCGIDKYWSKKMIVCNIDFGNPYYVAGLNRKVFNFVDSVL